MKLIRKSYTKQNGEQIPLWISKHSFDENQIVKAAGFRFCGDRSPDHIRSQVPRNSWYTMDHETAFKYFAAANPECEDWIRDEIEDLIQGKKDRIAQSRKASSDLEIPVPEGLSYFPFQKAGIEYLEDRNGVGFIADQMGLGKTIQSLGYINLHPEINNVLIVVPASLRLNWAKEAMKWLVNKDLTIGVVGVNQRKRNPYPFTVAKTKVPNTNIVIINYDILGKHKKALMARNWDLVIVDEVHYVKDNRTKRAKNLDAIVKNFLDEKHYKWEYKIPHRILLTGTPILNKPCEAWNPISLLSNAYEWSFWQFGKRYCGQHQTRYGLDRSGATNLNELQLKLREQMMIRRNKEDVLKELPPKVRNIIELSENGYADTLKKQNELCTARQDEIADLKEAVEIAKSLGNTEWVRQAQEKLREVSTAAFTEISRLRHELAVEKAPDVVDFAINALENNDKIIVFAHHHDVIDILMNGLKEFNPVKITGKTGTPQRDEAVEKFQTDDSVRAFVGNIKAAGVGLTLTSANTVIFAELDWTPAWLSQAEDRAHRIGQTDTVFVYHIVVDGSLDARMVELLIEKQEIIDKAMNEDRSDELNDLDIAEISDIIAEVKYRQELNEQDRKEYIRKKREYEQRKADRDREAEFEEHPQYETFDDEQKERIHQMLQMLASVCDGAIDLDDMGFNGRDTRFGKALALIQDLTDKQAFFGKKVCAKYWIQIPPPIYDLVYGEGSWLKKSGRKTIPQKYLTKEETKEVKKDEPVKKTGRRKKISLWDL